MKKFYLVSLILFMAAFVSGQSHTMRPANKKSLFQTHPYFQSPVFHSKPKSLLSLKRLKNASEALHRLDSIHHFGRNEENDQWISMYNDYFFYNDKNLVTEMVNSHSELTEFPEPDIRLVYEYNENEKVTAQRAFYPDEETGEWNEILRTNYNYDTHEMLTGITEVAYLEMEMKWEETKKTSYFYNEAGRLDSTLSENKINDTWQEDEKEKYEYTENGDLKTYKLLIRSFMEPYEWEYFYLENYAYDSNNNLITYDAYNWDSTEDVFRPTSHDEYTYSENDILSACISHSWDLIGGTWVPDYKEEFVYDADFTSGQIIIPPVYTENNSQFFKHKLVGYHSFEYIENNWVSYEKGDFFYGPASPVTAVIENEIPGISFYPNPAKSEITFRINNNPELSELKIYDLTGRIVLTQSLAKNSIVQTRHLKNGMYIFRITGIQNETLYSDKILVNQ